MYIKDILFAAGGGGEISDWGSAGKAVTDYAGSLPEMLPRFGVIALAVAIVIAALVIYSKIKGDK